MSDKLANVLFAVIVICLIVIAITNTIMVFQS